MLIINEFSPPVSTSARSLRNKRGFTLVELLVVSALLGVMATMALISISDFKDRTKTARASAEVRGLEKDIIAYASEKGILPANADAAGMENLKTLQDPWGNPYVYTRITTPGLAPAPGSTRIYVGTSINSDFDLFSKGPDKTSTDPELFHTYSKDDIVRGNDGAYVVIADRYGL